MLPQPDRAGAATGLLMLFRASGASLTLAAHGGLLDPDAAGIFADRVFALLVPFAPGPAVLAMLLEEWRPTRLSYARLQG